MTKTVSSFRFMASLFSTTVLIRIAPSYTELEGKSTPSHQNLQDSRTHNKGGNTAAGRTFVLIAEWGSGAWGTVPGTRVPAMAW